MLTPRTSPIVWLTIAALLVSSCTSAPERGADSEPELTPSKTAVEGEAGWRLASYARIDGQQTLVAVGEAMTGDSGQVELLHVELATGGLRPSKLVVNQYGAFAGTVKAGQTASSDGYQWLHLDDTPGNGPEAAVSALEPLDGGERLRTEETSAGELEVFSGDGAVVRQDDGDLLVSFPEEWVDDGGIVRRRLVRTALIHGNAEPIWTLTVADRRDDVVIDDHWRDLSPAHAMPLAAAVRQRELRGNAEPVLGTTDGDRTASAPLVAAPAAGVLDEHACTYASVYDDDVMIGASIDCPPTVEPLGPIEDLTFDGPIPTYVPGDGEDVPEALPPTAHGGGPSLTRSGGRAACWASELKGAIEGALFDSAWATSVGALALFLGVAPPAAGALAVLLAYLGMLRGLLVSNAKCAYTAGDPHLTTFDGMRYDLQAVGEFVAVRAPGLEIQQRFDGEGATWVVATAVRTDEHTVEVILPPDRDQLPRVVIDGTATHLSGDGEVLDDGTSVELGADSGEDPADRDVRVIAPDGSWLWIDANFTYQDVGVYLAEATAERVAGGVLGTPDGSHRNDFTLPDGTVLPLREIRTVEGLYGRFGNGWRVQPRKRLFTDGTAADWRTPEMLAVPKTPPSLADFTAEEIAEARKTCLDAGVTDTSVLDDCAYDVLVTGDPDWAAAGYGARGQPAAGGDGGPRGDADAPLLVAAYQCNVETLTAELAAGTHPDLRKDEGGWTALHFAAQEGCTDGVRALLRGGASVDSRADDGLFTPLHIAAQNGYAETVDELLGWGAAAAVTADDHRSPLLSAAFRGHSDVVLLLLKAGADVDVANDEGFTPLQAAVQEGYPGTARLLLGYGADVDRPDGNGRTALIAAAWDDSIESVRLLLEAGADPDRPRADGITALHAAAQEGHREVIETLLDAGADPRAQDDQGRTPRDFAADDVADLFQEQ